MPQIPIMIPILVTGVLVGSIIKSKTQRVSKKKLASASIVSGLLNAGYAYLTYILVPQQTFRGFTAPRASELGYVASSLIVGVLVVLAVVGIGLLYARFRRGEHEIESDDLTLKEELK